MASCLPPSFQNGKVTEIAPMTPTEFVWVLSLTLGPREAAQDLPQPQTSATVRTPRNITERLTGPEETLGDHPHRA